jgi:hypothetical protein
MLNTEHLFRPTVKCLSLQKDISKKMRLILVQWLIKVNLQFKMKPETLFLTMNLVDRFSELEVINKRHY